MQKKYIVRLSKEERNTLREVVKKLKGSSQKVRRAQILLKADADGPAWSDSRIAEAFGCRRQTVEMIRQRFVECGFQETLEGKKRAESADGEVARWRAGGEDHRHAPWAAAERLRQLDAPPACSQGCRVGNRRCDQLRNGAAHAKKNGMTNRKIEYWVIPPEADAEFVANMEEVLETYAKPYDPTRPVLCMDEQPVQLVKETRKPIAATAKHPRRVDYEYERAGTASIFMFTEPLSGWRRQPRGSRRRKWIGHSKWRGCSTVVTRGATK